jgi:hypothetical protein
MSAVVIGIDPHKASHTAVAVDERELPLGGVRVRATAVQGAGAGSVDGVSDAVDRRTM